MKIEVEVKAGDMYKIHHSMGYLDIEEGRVLVLAVGIKKALRKYPKVIYKQVEDAEEPLLQGMGLSHEQLENYPWVVYADDNDIYTLPLEDFIEHTTVI